MPLKDDPDDTLETDMEAIARTLATLDELEYDDAPYWGAELPSVK